MAQVSGETEAPVKPAGTGQGSRGRVLIVDDDATIRALLTTTLSTHGYVVDPAADGNEAMNKIWQTDYDVVLSDIAMPDMDGIAVLRAVRERDLETPVILLTGRPDVETAADAVRFGALRYLTKPLDPDKIIEAVGFAGRLKRVARLKREAFDSERPRHELLIGDLAGLEEALQAALASSFMAYQPIVDLYEGRPIAFEALLRSQHATLPSPKAILWAAERLGKVPSVGTRVRELVAEKIERTGAVADFYVNTHPSELADDELYSANAPLSRCARSVVLEITERDTLGGVPDLPARVAELRRLGYRIAIDDLGAGFAGLTSFANLDPDVAKLDMSLTHGVDREPLKRKLVESIISLCRDLGILVIAEGVETRAQLDTLTSLDCPMVQGMLLGEPSPRLPGYDAEPPMTGPTIPAR